MEAYPTPHIKATPEDFAKIVLMPGDPLRSQWIAAHFLEGAKLVNNVRGVQGYTGLYKGEFVSVMASGMGMPSMGIYAYELFSVFGVQSIIRIGSAGALSERIKLRDIVIGQGTCTNSNFASQYRLPGSFAPLASYRLLKLCEETAGEQGLSYHVGNLLTSDVFYGDEADLPKGQKSFELWAKMGVLAVEMEAAALYMTAARLGKEALAVCTVSDHLVTGEETTSEERQSSFTEMIGLALEVGTRSV